MSKFDPETVTVSVGGVDLKPLTLEAISAALAEVDEIAPPRPRDPIGEVSYGHVPLRSAPEPDPYEMMQYYTRITEPPNAISFTKRTDPIRATELGAEGEQVDLQPFLLDIRDVRATVEKDPIEGYRVRVQISARAVNRTDRARTISIAIERCFYLGRDLKTGRPVSSCVRELLLEIAAHEIDECLFVNGERLNDPHAPPKPAQIGPGQILKVSTTVKVDVK